MYLISTVPTDIYQKLDEIINKKHTVRANHELAGNIQSEYLIPDGKGVIWPFLNALMDEYFKKYPGFLARTSCMTNKASFTLGLHNLWVNFQKKYEFNPVHVHDGLFSFVIWHKVPYTMADEKARFPHMKDDEIRAGHFAFLVINEIGQIQSQCIAADKEWEGKIAMFPASMNHLVYPFYTSDDYRISISGNVGFLSIPE